MFCQKCGTQLPDGAAFCPVCGSGTGQPPQPQPPQPQLPQPQPSQPPQQPKPPKKVSTVRIVFIALVAALFIASVVLVIVLVSRDSGSSGSGSKGSSSKTEEKGGFSEPEDLLAYYVENVLAMDTRKLIENVPDAEIEAYADAEDISKSEAKKEMLESLQDALDYLADEYDEIDPEKVGKVSVEIRDKDTWTTKEVRAFNEAYEDENGVALNVEEGMTVEVKLTVKYDGDTYKYIASGIDVLKIDGSWYVYSFNIYDIFAGLYTEMS